MNFKRLRRPSLKSSDIKPQAVSGVPNSSISETPPLYARFATTHRTHDGSHAKPIVSGPMALTAKPSLHRSPSRGNGHERDARQLKRVPSKPEQESVLTAPPSRSSSKANLSAVAQVQATRIRQSVSLDGGPTLSSSALPTPKNSSISALPSVDVASPTAKRSQPEMKTRDERGSGHALVANEAPVRFPISLPAARNPSPERRGTQQAFTPSHASKRSSVLALPKDEHRLIEPRPSAAPLQAQRPAEANPADPPVVSSSLHVRPPSPRKASRTPSPSTPRNRSSRVFEQQRISYDLSPENYWKTMQAQVLTARPPSPQKRPSSPQKRPASPQKRPASPQKRPAIPTPSDSFPSGVTSESAPRTDDPARPSRHKESHIGPHVRSPPPERSAPSLDAVKSQSSLDSTAKPKSLSSSQLSISHRTSVPSSVPVVASRPSLTTTPSIIRKKYSPLAAFGLPTSGSQVFSSEPEPVLPLQALQDDKVRFCLFIYSMSDS